ncbi:MAG: DUF4349 domain-containing protein [SAR202 cluster bacterium]|nr:DUF4349 domain-containing protein [SAR202 cluster bacterium]
MQHAEISDTSPGRFWPNLMRKLPLGNTTWLGIAAVLAVAVAVLLTWMFTAGPWAGDGDSYLTSESPRTAYGVDGKLAPPIEPSPGAFGGFGDMAVTITNDSMTSSGFAMSARGASPSPSPSVINALGQRQIISQGSMSVEVSDVTTAASQVRAIAEGAGGFVEQLSSYGVDEFRQSNLTIRVPQAEFFSVFEQIKALGEVQSENAGSEDVSEQFIDLEARLKSAQREELSLLSLLDRAEKISEILIIEQELTRVRGELERVQGQLNFLERRVDLATITVSLSPPKKETSRAPSGSLNIASSNVTDSVNAIKAVVGQVNGKLDQVYTSTQDGRQRSNMTVRVFAADFNLLVTAVEDQGSLTSKEVQEGKPGDTASEEPDSRLDITFYQKESSNLGRDLAIYTPIGSVAFLIVIGGLIFGAYRMGLRRED